MENLFINIYIEKTNKGEDMFDYVEDYDNIIYQVFDEFANFLNSVYYFHKSDSKMIKNMALDCMRIHARILCNFFTESRTNKDDLIFTDIIDVKGLSINMPKDISVFINKTTAHLSKRRGKVYFDNNKFFETIKNIVIAIKDFISLCETNMKSEYQNDYLNENVEELKDYINDTLNNICNLLLSC